MCSTVIYVTGYYFPYGVRTNKSLIRSARGPNFFEADWQLAKTFKFKERGLEFRWDVFNVINRQNLALPNTQVDSPAAGLITDIQICSTCGNGMRNMQFGAHLTF